MKSSSHNAEKVVIKLKRRSFIGRCLRYFPLVYQSYRIVRNVRISFLLANCLFKGCRLKDDLDSIDELASKAQTLQDAIKKARGGDAPIETVGFA